MSDAQRPPARDELLEAVWNEARELIRRLEGSTVQRLSIAAGDAKIEIERAPGVAPPAAAPAAAGLSGPVASGPGPGPGVDPGARTASGFYSLNADGGDNRIPVLAPLVGTFYRAPQPGAPPFVQEGDVVEGGSAVCIVEAMKMMNEVVAADGGRVAEFVVDNGDPVEFEQVLMYLEPVGEE